MSKIKMSDEKFEQLLDWFKRNGGYLHPSLERRANQAGTFGLYAKQPIAPGKELSKVSDKLVIGHRLMSREMPEAWHSQTKVIYNLLLEKQMGPASFYWPIFECFPTMTDFRNFHPYFMTDSEYERLIKLDVTFRFFKENYQQDLKNTQDIIIKEQENLVASGKLTVDQTFLAEDIVWGFFIYKTRSWGDGIVPVLDLFNHSNQLGVMKTIGNTGDVKNHSLVSKIDYYPGDQVYISYGNKDHLRLAFDYGFQDPENFDLVIPMLVNYTGQTPLHYGIGKLLINRGMNAEIKDDGSIYCNFKNYYLENDRRGLLNAFTEKGVSRDLLQLFRIFAIENYSELEAGMGHLTKALKLLKGYLEDMIKSSDYLEQIETELQGQEDLKELKSQELSTGFKTCLLTLQRRCKILKISQAWILEQYQQTLG